MSFLAEYDLLPAERKVAAFYRAVYADPVALFDELRESAPILVTPGPVVVSRHCDCIEVMSRQSEFTVAEYRPRMEFVTGPFFLGADDTDLYDRQKSALTLAFRRGDLEKLRPRLRERAEALVEAHRSEDGTFDAVSSLTRRLPAEIMVEYMGMHGVNLGQVEEWATKLFKYLFADPFDDAETKREAAACAKAMKSYVDGLFAHRRLEGASGNTVIDRLLSGNAGRERHLTDVELRSLVIGVVTGAVQTTSAAAVNILLELFDRPDELSTAVALSRDDDLVGLEAHCFEALRLRPQAQILTRTSVKEATIARGTERATLVPSGRRVLVAIGSAMRDARASDDPSMFRAGRSEGIALHFGSGSHTCFGRHLNRIQIVEIVRAVLRVADVSKSLPELETDGTFPTRLTLAML